MEKAIAYEHATEELRYDPWEIDENIDEEASTCDLKRVVRALKRQDVRRRRKDKNSATLKHNADRHHVEYEDNWRGHFLALKKAVLKYLHGGYEKDMEDTSISPDYEYDPRHIEFIQYMDDLRASNIHADYLPLDFMLYDEDPSRYEYPADSDPYLDFDWEYDDFPEVDDHEAEDIKNGYHQPC